MRVWVEFDPKDGVWTLFHEECEIDSPEAVEKWRSQLVTEFKIRTKKKIPLLIDMKGLSIDPSIAKEYGEMAQALAREYTSEVVRYGRPVGFTLSTIRVQSLIQGHAANVHPDRRSALEAMAKLRAK